MTVTCRQAIDAATTEGEVVLLGRDFISHVDFSDLHRIPTACRPPGKFKDGSDITGYAFDLLRHNCATDGQDEVVGKLTDFFSRAAVRLSQIAAFGDRRKRNDEREPA